MWPLTVGVEGWLPPSGELGWRGLGCDRNEGPHALLVEHQEDHDAHPKEGKEADELLEGHLVVAPGDELEDEAEDSLHRGDPFMRWAGYTTPESGFQRT